MTIIPPKKKTCNLGRFFLNSLERPLNLSTTSATRLKGAQEAYKNGVRGFTGHPKSCPEGSQQAYEKKMCSEMFPGRVWDTLGTPFGRPFGKAKRFRSGPEQLFIHKRVETLFSKGLQRILKRFIE